MHGRKKSDLPQTKEEKDAVQAKISNYKKASRACATMFCPTTKVLADQAESSPFKSGVTSPCSRSASLAFFDWRVIPRQLIMWDLVRSFCRSAPIHPTAVDYRGV